MRSSASGTRSGVGERPACSFVAKPNCRKRCGVATTPRPVACVPLFSFVVPFRRRSAFDSTRSSFDPAGSYGTSWSFLAREVSPVRAPAGRHIRLRGVYGPPRTGLHPRSPAGGAGIAYAPEEASSPPGRLERRDAPCIFRGHPTKDVRSNGSRVSRLITGDTGMPKASSRRGARVKRRKDGRVDQRTREGRKIAARMAKARAARGRRVGFFAWLFS